MEKTIYSKQINQVLFLLKDLRQKSGLTQKELAVIINKPQSFISKYEIGERRLDIIEIKTICESLGYSLPEFVKKLENIINETK